MRYSFLVATYASERLKVISAWSMIRDQDLPVRPHPTDRRGRSFHEHMVHQCVSEDAWFRTMLGISVEDSPLPEQETRLAFMQRYAAHSGKRLAALRTKPESWFEDNARFFEVERTRAWILTRRLNHTAHHRGQVLAMLRMLGRELYSNYGPTADTGGLPQNHASTVYAYESIEATIAGETSGNPKRALPGPGGLAVTERPGGKA